MIIVCAWCKRTYGEKEPLDDKSTTHGMCEECHNGIVAQLVERLPEEQDVVGSTPTDTTLSEEPPEQGNV
jgi:hypothetical protein